MRAPETTSWHSASWQTRPAQQQPVYADPKALERVVAQISRLPPIVVSWEVEALRSRLAAAQRGEGSLRYPRRKIGREDLHSRPQILSNPTFRDQALK